MVHELAGAMGEHLPVRGDQTVNYKAAARALVPHWKDAVKHHTVTPRGSADSKTVDAQGAAKRCTELRRGSVRDVGTRLGLGHSTLVVEAASADMHREIARGRGTEPEREQA